MSLLHSKDAFSSFDNPVHGCLPVHPYHMRGLVFKETVLLHQRGSDLHKSLDSSSELIRWIGHHKEIES